MAILTRQTQKVFAGNANGDMLAVFGSMKTGTPQYSSNVETLQSDIYSQGWSQAILEDKAPYMEEMNAVQYGLSYQIAYLLQEGIPEYDTGTTYSSTSIVKVINNNELELYHSLQNENTGNPLTNTSYWARAYFTNTGVIGQPQFTLNFNTLPENCIWLEGATVSRTTYSTLFGIYGTTYGEGDGSTTFQLPDFRNRTLWGGTTADYLSAGLPDIKGEFGHVADEATVITRGAFYVIARNYYGGPDSGDDQAVLGFAASRYSSIYGNSSTVQPPALKVRVYTRYQ